MINKMQKEYLETRLKAIIREKLDGYDKQEKHKKFGEVLYEHIRNGNVALKPIEEVEKYFGYSNPDLHYYFNTTIAEEVYKKISDEKSKYETKLREKALKIMDKVMFEGLNLDDAMQEINKL